MARTMKVTTGSGEPDSSILDQQREHDAKRDILIDEEGLNDAVEGIAPDLFGDVEDNETVENLSFTLTDGREVVMRAPSVFEGFRVDQLLSDTPIAQYSRQYAMALMHVESVNGEKFHKPTTKAELYSRANFIGSRGMEEIGFAYMKYFAAGPNLRNVKKNLL